MPVSSSSPTSAAGNRRVVIVDEDRALARRLDKTLRAAGFEVEVVHDAISAIAITPQFRPQIGLIDIPRDHSIGFELLSRLRDLQKDIYFVLITAHADVEMAVRALREGAFHYLTKPLDEHQLVAILERCLEVAASERELAAARRALEHREDLYKRAIAYAHAVAYQRDYATKSFTFIDEGIYDLTGYHPHELTPAVWGGLIEERVMEGEGTGLPVEEAIRRTWAGQLKIWNADYRIRTRDGQERWLADSSVQIEDEDGKPIGSLGILQDITHRKRIEEELRKLNLELEDRVAQRTEQLRRSNLEIQDTNRVLRETVSQLRQREHIMAEELRLAQEVQQHFLPQAFPFRGQLDFAAYYHSCSKIGGDLYDAFALGDGVAGFYVADASGHGVSAALVTAVLKVSVERLRQALRCPNGASPLPESRAALQAFLSDLSHTLLDTIPDRSFVTFLMGVLNLETGQLFLANAGHNPPIRYSALDRRVEEIPVPNNLPLGLYLRWQFEIGEARLLPGDKLVFYTDGITEALNSANQEYSVRALLRDIADLGPLPAEKLLSGLTDRLAAFEGEVEPGDDQSVLVITYQPSPSPVTAATLDSGAAATNATPASER